MRLSMSAVVSHAEPARAPDLLRHAPILSVPIARDRRRHQSSLVWPGSHENPGKTALSTAPRIDIDTAAFWSDPYPMLAKLRKEAPIAFVPQLGSTLLASRDDISISEKQIDVSFSVSAPRRSRKRSASACIRS